MKENDFSIYQTFYNKDEMLALVHLLETNNIIFLAEEDSFSFDPSFANNDYQKKFVIKLQKKDFQKLDTIQNEIYSELAENIEKDYYLFDFSDEKLIEIIIKKDEWGKFDFVLAQKILKERGKEINEETLENFKKQRINELSKNTDISIVWVIISYLLTISSRGILGILIGWHILTHKKTLPNGDKVYGYSKNDRKHGKIISIIGTICLFIYALFLTYNLFILD